MKLLLKLLLALVLLVALAFGLAIYFIDSIAREGIQQGATYALGVETTVGDMDIKLRPTVRVGMHELQVNNPPGFASPHFVRLEEAQMRFAVGSALTDTLEVPFIGLRGFDVHLEKVGDQTNYEVILDNLAGVEDEEAPAPEGGGGEPEVAEGPEGSGGKKLSIQKIVIQNVRADVDLVPQGGELTHFAITIPEIVLDDLRDDMTTAELSSLIIQTLLRAILQSGQGLLPEALLQDLQGELGSLQGVAFEVTGEVMKQAQELGGEATKALGESAGKLGGKLGEEVGGAVKGLGGLLKKD